MAVVTNIFEYNGAGTTETADIAHINMGSTDATGITPASHPITAGEHSYEKYVKMEFVGIANKVDNLQVWKSVGALHAEADLKASTRTATQTGYLSVSYAQPVATASSKASWDIEEADPGEANLGIGGALAGNLAADGKSDYLCLQYQTTGSHPAGNITQLTLTFQWDEQ